MGDLADLEGSPIRNAANGITGGFPQASLGASASCNDSKMDFFEAVHTVGANSQRKVE